MHLLFFAQTPVENFQNVMLRTGFSLQQFLSQLIVFLIVCFFLWRFAYKPVFAMLDLRRKTIQESMANADRVKKELADAEAARLSIIQKANEQANSIVADAQKVAAVQTERLAREATVQAEDIIRKAHEAAALERDRLLNELKREVGALVIQTTEKIAGKVLNADDQSRLNSETLEQLSATNN
jgi:F-type H+-transporting ATPase subunit b